MKNIKFKAVLFTLMALVQGVAFAAGGGQAVKQVEYVTKFGNGIVNMMLVALFIGSLIVILGAVLMFFKDYVMAKDDREKKFSVGQLFAGMLVASILAAPTGFFVISNDLLAGQSGVSAEPTDVFVERTVN